MQITLSSLSLILAIFCFVVMAFYVAASAGRRNTSARLLVAFIVCVTMTLSNFLLMTSNVLSAAPSFAFLGNTVGLAAAPLLYLYARSLAEKEYKFRAVTLWRFAPVAIFTATVLLAYTFQPSDEKSAILSNPDYPSLINSPFLPAAIFAFVFFYLFQTIRVLLKHQARVADFHASDGPAGLSWLRISVFGAMFVWTGSLIHQVVIAFWRISWLDAAFSNLLAVAALIFGLYFLFNALRQSSQPSLPLPDPAAFDEKYGEHRLSDSDLANFARMIETYLEEAKPQLSNTLTIDDLSAALPMSSRELSQTLNRHFGKTFFEFINERRVRYAMARLKADRRVSVTEIMYEAGFASKSSFYAAFKSIAGVTPSAYRRDETVGRESQTQANSAASL